MIRVLIAVLIAANLAFFGWTRGWLGEVVGMPADDRHEPDRQRREVRPDQVRVLPPEAAAPRGTAGSSPISRPQSVTAPVPMPETPSSPSRAPSVASAASAPTACMEAGPFDAPGLEAAQSALRAALPEVNPTTPEAGQAGGWLVYIGRYADPAAMARREANLTRRNLPYTEVTGDRALTPGLELGRFDDRAGAEKALARFVQLGLSSARVVETSVPAVRYALRLDAIDPVIATRLKSLTDPAFANGFAACPPSPER